MSFNVIVTVGPSSLKDETIRQIDGIGPCIFRINSSHLSLEQIKQAIDKMRSFLPDIKLMIDLPGNKIRTSNSFEPRKFKAEEYFDIDFDEVNYPQFFNYLSCGDILYTNDSLNSMTVQRVDSKKGVVTLQAQEDGQLSNNKGIHIRGKKLELPFLFEKDVEIIKLVNEFGLNYLALSFVRNVEDIKQAAKLLTNRDVKIISKVEKAEAIENLDSILEYSDTILIDRGDLSNDVGMAALPFCQDFIIKKARLKHRSVFLATQFLKYMETNRIPLIAEVMGLYSDIKEGVSGIQLSEETAVGKYPVECVRLVFEMYAKVNSDISQEFCRGL